MVSICGKKFACTREKLLLSDIQAKKEAKDLDRFLQKLKEKGEHNIQSNNVRVLSGTIIPNSTFKRRISSDATVVNQNRNAPSADFLAPIIEEDAIQVQAGSSIRLKYAVKTFNEIADESSDIISQSKDRRRSSILSGTGTLDELKELSDLLHKSTYIPKQKKTRTSTIDKIKNAIEKEKHQKVTTVANKSENTIEKVVTLVDASTLAEFKLGKTMVKKKKKSRTELKSQAAETSLIKSSKKVESTKKKHITKPKRKTDFGVQSTLHKRSK